MLSVVPDQIVQLTTTHTPSFLGLSDRPAGLWRNTSYGSDIIIGVVDSGIWPESPSFNDQGLGSLPRNWRGFCQDGPDFPASQCNNKIIGARFFYKGYEAQYGPLNGIKSARDENGHGTHCASIAAGSAVDNVGYKGYAVGEARGVALKARIAAYKIFWGTRSLGSVADILGAIDQAIDDGVDVISLSVSLRGSHPEYNRDQISIAAFRATQRGILFSASAGNSGPQPFTVSNVSPWMLTVAASSVDRQFSAHVVLGNGRVFKGSTLYDFRQLGNNSTSSLMLVTGQAGGSSYCAQGQLDRSIVYGKIVICEMSTSRDDMVAKSLAVQQAGGRGMILIDHISNGEEVRAKPYIIPATIVTHSDGNNIKSYVYSTPIPTATIEFKGTVIGPSPSAPRLAAFSSRGPNQVTPQILKPDVTAPGLNILAAWKGQDINTRSDHYSIQSGTSMACPHVSGLCALLRKAHPSWSPAAIKSAIMTTSYNYDNAGNHLMDLAFSRPSTPFVHGSGHVDPEKAVNPGLVYDLDTTDYVAFLCSIGYDYTSIYQFVQDPSMINCRTKPLPSPGDLNYPSFAAVFKSANDVVRYTRVVKNVGSSVNAVYRVSVSAPPNVQVNVSPTTLKFSANKQKLSYTISFTSTGGFQIPTSGLISSGSIEWSDGIHRVRSPIAAYWPYMGVQEDFAASI